MNLCPRIYETAGGSSGFDGGSGVFFCGRGIGIVAHLTVEFVFDSQDEQAAREHEGAHDVVANVKASRRGFDPSHHVRADPASEVAAGVDERDGTGGGGTGQEGRRDGPPYAHGRMDADRGEADEEERHAET